MREYMRSRLGLGIELQAFSSSIRWRRLDLFELDSTTSSLDSSLKLLCILLVKALLEDLGRRLDELLSLDQVPGQLQSTKKDNDPVVSTLFCLGAFLVFRSVSRYRAGRHTM